MPCPLARAGKTSDGCDKGVGPGVLTGTVFRVKSAHGGKSDSLGRHSTVTPSCLLRRRDMQHMSLRYFLLIAAVRTKQWWWSEEVFPPWNSWHAMDAHSLTPGRRPK